MSEDKAKTTKRTSKKAVTVTEVAKPKAAVAAPRKNTAGAVAEAAPVVAKAPTVKAKSATKTPAADSKSKTAVAPAAKPAAKTTKKAAAAGKLIEKPAAPSQEERQRWIATAAYHRAEKRGFAPGYEEQDWFDAEAEIDALVGKA